MLRRVLLSSDDEAARKDTRRTIPDTRSLLDSTIVEVATCAWTNKRPTMITAAVPRTTSRRYCIRSSIAAGRYSVRPSSTIAKFSARSVANASDVCVSNTTDPTWSSVRSERLRTPRRPLVSIVITTVERAVATVLSTAIALLRADTFFGMVDAFFRVLPVSRAMRTRSALH